MDALEEMIRLRGGKENLGSNNCLQATISWYVQLFCVIVTLAVMKLLFIPEGCILGPIVGYVRKCIHSLQLSNSALFNLIEHLLIIVKSGLIQPPPE